MLMCPRRQEVSSSPVSLSVQASRRPTLEEIPRCRFIALSLNQFSNGKGPWLTQLITGWMSVAKTLHYTSQITQKTNTPMHMSTCKHTKQAQRYVGISNHAVHDMHKDPMNYSSGYAFIASVTNDIFTFTWSSLTCESLTHYPHNQKIKFLD